MIIRMLLHNMRTILMLTTLFLSAAYSTDKIDGAEKKERLISTTIITTSHESPPTPSSTSSTPSTSVTQNQELHAALTGDLLYYILTFVPKGSYPKVALTCKDWNDISKSFKLPTNQTDAVAVINQQIEKVLSPQVKATKGKIITQSAIVRWDPGFVLKVNHIPNGWLWVSQSLFLQPELDANGNPTIGYDGKLKYAPHARNITSLATLPCSQFWPLMNQMKTVCPDAVQQLLTYITPIMSDATKTREEVINYARFMPFIERHIFKNPRFTNTDVELSEMVDWLKSLFSSSIQDPFDKITSVTLLKEALMCASDSVLGDLLEKAIGTGGHNIDDVEMATVPLTLEDLALKIHQRTGLTRPLYEVARALEKPQFENGYQGAARLYGNLYAITGDRNFLSDKLLALNNAGLEQEALDLRLQLVYLERTPEQSFDSRKIIANKFMEKKKYAQAEGILLQCRKDATAFSQSNEIIFMNELIRLYEVAYAATQDLKYAEKKAILHIELAKIHQVQNKYVDEDNLKPVARYYNMTGQLEKAARICEVVFHKDLDFGKVESKIPPSFQHFLSKALVLSPENSQQNLTRLNKYFNLESSEDKEWQLSNATSGFEALYHFDKNPVHLDKAINACERLVQATESGSQHGKDNAIKRLAHLYYLKGDYKKSIELFFDTKDYQNTN